jgi:hypothetical protein
VPFLRLYFLVRSFHLVQQEVDLEYRQSVTVCKMQQGELELMVRICVVNADIM